MAFVWHLWKSKLCRGKVSFDVEKYVLPWKSKFCRGRVCFAVEKSVLRRKSMLCRGKVSFAVERKFCRGKLRKGSFAACGKVSFSVILMGHSKIYISSSSVISSTLTPNRSIEMTFRTAQCVANHLKIT